MIWDQDKGSNAAAQKETSNFKRKGDVMLRGLFHDEKGQDMIEYALLGSFISIVSILTIQAIGPLVNSFYVLIQDALTPTSTSIIDEKQVYVVLQ